jgi:hypothetical protein
MVHVRSLFGDRRSLIRVHHLPERVGVQIDDTLADMPANGASVGSELHGSENRRIA